MLTWEVIREWVVSGVIQNAFWVIVSILFVQFGQRTYERIIYGRWRVIVREKGKDLVDREISPGKLKEIRGEPSEMSVFVKGVASPYEWINCDVLTEGKTLGLFVEDRDNRRLIIDLDKNPAEKSKKTERRVLQKPSSKKATPVKKKKA